MLHLKKLLLLNVVECVQQWFLGLLVSMLHWYDDEVDDDDNDDDGDDIDDNDNGDDQTCETRASPSPRRPGEGNLSSCRFLIFIDDWIF